MQVTYPQIPGELDIWYWRMESETTSAIKNRNESRRVSRKTALAILADYFNCSPDNLTVVKNSHGKPFLYGFPNFHYSLSHSHDAGVMAVSVNPVGIDLEKISSSQRDDLANSFLGSLALSSYSNLPTLERPSAFAGAWTQREAFVKAIGLGIGDGWELMKNVFSQLPLFFPQLPNNTLISDCWHLHHVTIAPNFKCSICNAHSIDTIRLLCKKVVI
jgi:4'-phosphopantetheinyl transferase